LSVALKKLEPIRYHFEAIGTHWFLDFYNPVIDYDYELLIMAVKQRIDNFDLNYSRFRQDSLVTRMSLKAGSYPLPEDAYAMLNLYKSLYKVTDGLVTPLIGQPLSDAGYDANYSFKPKKMHSPLSWDEVIDFDESEIRLSKPALLDFGAAGKGYLVDIIVELIRSAGITDFCVNAGGDMYYSLSDLPTADVGLEHPTNDDEVVGIARIKNRSICGSAGNRRKWANFNHILNPKTLSSPLNLQAVWVVADHAILADGLSTALCFKSAIALQKHYDFEYAAIKENGSLTYSKSFPAEFF
jgi:thiamine biosynthesis lipoprotein